MLSRAKLFALVTLAVFAIISASNPARADTAVGKVTQVLINGQEDITVYFKIDPMPPGVTAWLYANQRSANVAGCTSTGSETLVDRILSLLLFLKGSDTTVRVSYCIDANGYGLITTPGGSLQSTE
ncbi:MAG: hypothetical protein MJE77_03855 [Proteobacteria bacterium]|nr:hypothetical protein [Pseudomonadota bacterium]